MILKGNKGQLSIFVIVAIVIIAVIGLLFIFSNEKTEENSGLDYSNLEDFNPHLIIQNCLEDASSNVIYEVSVNSGHSLLDANYFKSLETDVPPFFTETSIVYGYYNGKTFLPSEEELKQNLQNRVSSLVYTCLTETLKGDFNPLIYYFETNVSLFDEFIEFELNSGMVLSREEYKKEFQDSFYSSKDIPLKHLFKSAEDIVIEQTLGNEITLSSILDNGINVEVIEIDSNNKIIILTKNCGKFVFAIRNDVYKKLF